MPVHILSLEISPTGDIPILVGNTVQLTVRFQNNSPSLRLYNLNVFVDLPDGLSISSSESEITAKTEDAQGGSHYSYINLTDLVGMEAPYQLHLTLACHTRFRNDETIPFSYVFQGAAVHCQVDTLPRGSYDVGNQVLTSQSALSIKSARYAGWLDVPAKVLKGAGTSLEMQDDTHRQTAVCHLINNKRLPTHMSVKVMITDSCRYLGSVTSLGMDEALFLNPQVYSLFRQGNQVTVLDFGWLTLSEGSEMQVTFFFAVWDKTNHNQGTYIDHGTQQEMVLEIETKEGISNYYGIFSAMEIIIDTFNRHPTTDVGKQISLNYTCSVGQYHEIAAVQIEYHIPDGVSLLSSTTPADASDLEEGIYTWALPLALKNQICSVDIIGTINSSYNRWRAADHTPLTVAANDFFYFSCQVTGTVFDKHYLANDSSVTAAVISTAVISKEFLQGYDADGIAKPHEALAPGDMAEFRLVYDSNGIQAVQKNISLHDFFPLSANPIDQLSYLFNGRTPQSNALVNPHGVSFYYGDLPGNQHFSVEYQVPIETLGSPAENNNLLKLKGTDTFGVNYGKRVQVLIPITKPNLTLTKQVVGMDLMHIKANEIYQIDITLENGVTDTTDAYLFTLTDTLSEWLTYVNNSIQVTGEGTWRSPLVYADRIELLIEALAPGQVLHLSYQVAISSWLAPGVEIKTIAATTNPYAQHEETSFQYQTMEQSASLSFFSEKIQFDIIAEGTLPRVNSEITYRIHAIVPLGTIAYKLITKISLPEHLQTYRGNCFFNGQMVTPSMLSNQMEFDEIPVVDARELLQSLEYVCSSTVMDADIETGSTTSIQTTHSTLSYQTTTLVGTVMLLTAETPVPIYHPNYNLILTAQNKQTGAFLPEQDGISGLMQILFRLTIFNDGLVAAVDGVVEIVLDTNFSFLSLESTHLCSLQYNSITRIIVIKIPRLEAGISALASFVLALHGQAFAGQMLQVQAKALRYMNDLSLTHIYRGPMSNTFTGNILAGISLLPSAYDKLDNQTSYRASRPGEVIEIVNHLKNTGGGSDSFHLEIEQVGLAYSLFIDQIWQVDVLPETLLSRDFYLLQQVPPNAMRVIRIVTMIPLDSPLGQRYDFVVTGRSKTAPYPFKTVVNIDPS